jgi:hypothetical protein
MQMSGALGEGMQRTLPMRESRRSCAEGDAGKGREKRAGKKGGKIYGLTCSADFG